MEIEPMSNWNDPH